jgi:hypothetical protein
MEKTQDSKANRRRPLMKNFNKNMHRFDDVLDDALEATFPASDPPAIPLTRIGKPYRAR